MKVEHYPEEFQRDLIRKHSGVEDDDDSEVEIVKVKKAEPSDEQRIELMIDSKP
jgi:hypothetical protein